MCLMVFHIFLLVLTAGISWAGVKFLRVVCGVSGLGFKTGVSIYVAASAYCFARVFLFCPAYWLRHASQSSCWPGAGGINESARKKVKPLGSLTSSMKRCFEHEMLLLFVAAAEGRPFVGEADLIHPGRKAASQTTVHVWRKHSVWLARGESGAVFLKPWVTVAFGESWQQNIFSGLLCLSQANAIWGPAPPQIIWKHRRRYQRW